MERGYREHHAFTLRTFGMTRGLTFVLVPVQIEPYLPYEFTCEGMLQRVNAFIENQVLLLYSSVGKKAHVLIFKTL